MRKLVPLVVAIGILVGISGGTPATTPRPRFWADSPFVRDAAGRVRFFHSVNAVWKIPNPPSSGVAGPGYYPPSSVYPAPYGVDQAHSYFDSRDAELLAELGMSGVRLGLIWAGVEPQRGVFDEVYLDRIADLVHMLAAEGVEVMLDFHQDMYNERFDGEGAPDWATPQNIPTTNFFGFPGNLFTPAAMNAYDLFWLNRDGLWDHYRDAWKHVAARFKDEPNVIGYGLFNEPWPGTQWATCAQPLSCPVFDTLFLQRFYEHVIAGIRQVDPTGLIFWDANVITNFGAANQVGLLSPIADLGANQGVSFHLYCLVGGFVPQLQGGDDPACPLMNDVAFLQQGIAAERNRSAMFLTEFGATDQLSTIDRIAASADQNMVSWQYWQYGEWSDPTTSGSGTQGLFTDDLDRPGSLKQAKADALVRTFPRAVAGTPLWFSFDPATKVFTLAYLADPSITEPTEIYVPVARHYGGNYLVDVSGPADVTSAADAPVLMLASHGAGRVTVTVSPA